MKTILRIWIGFAIVGVIMVIAFLTMCVDAGYERHKQQQQPKDTVRVEPIGIEEQVNYYDSCIQHLKYHEGLSETIYIDNDGSPTIGYGHHLLPGENITRITQEQADSLLRLDFNKKLSYIEEKHGQTGTKAMALALFVYNCGAGAYCSSTLKKLVDNNQPIDHEIVKWCHFTTQDGEVVVSDKLRQRREFELKLYNYDQGPS